MQTRWRRNFLTLHGFLKTLPHESQIMVLESWMDELLQTSLSRRMRTSIISLTKDMTMNTHCEGETPSERKESKEVSMEMKIPEKRRKWRKFLLHQDRPQLKWILLHLDLHLLLLIINFYFPWTSSSDHHWRRILRRWRK